MLWFLIRENSGNRFLQSCLESSFLSLRGSFFNARKKMVIAFGAISDYMVDALKLPKQAPRFSGESTDMCPGAVLMEHNTSSAGQFWTFLVNRWLQMVQC
ncbi:hypothetical protein TNCV_775251 [Trichonephila clavipes]|nr:hypothetical protein TNCV_775251 [Trichonephila clavipes]